MRKLLISCLLYLLFITAEVSATDLEFSQRKFDSLPSETHKQIYTVATKGYNDFPLGLSQKDVIERLGRDNLRKLVSIAFSTTKESYNYMFYSNYCSFQLILLQFKDNKLITVSFHRPTETITKSQISETLGDPGNITDSRFIYQSNNSAKEISFTTPKDSPINRMKKNLIGDEFVTSIVIGNFTEGVSDRARAFQDATSYSLHRALSTIPLGEEQEGWHRYCPPISGSCFGVC